MLAHNTTNYEEIALKRFEENIGVLNFYFDTPIITQIQLELRWVILIALSWNQQITQPWSTGSPGWMSSTR